MTRKKPDPWKHSRASKRLDQLNAMMGSPAVGFITHRAPGCGYELREGRTGAIFIPMTMPIAEIIIKAIIKRHANAVAQGVTNAT